MARPKKTTEEVNEIETEIEAANTLVDNASVKVESEEVNEVLVAPNGKFQLIKVKGGFQIFGPTGQVISPVIENEAKAGDMVTRFNLGR